MAASPPTEDLRMNVTAAGASLGGIVAAQMMFNATAQAAESVGSSGASGASAGSQASGVGVAVLAMALDNERSLVNILA
jgi:hypothetical protein